MDEPVLVSAAPATADRRRLFVLIGIAVVLVLGLLVVPKVLGGGSGSDQLDDLSGPLTTPTTTAPSKTPAQVVAHSGKDPFQPLVKPRAPERAAPTVVTTPKATTVKLLDVYLDPAGKATAKVKVDASELTVKASQQFSGSYRVLSLDAGTRCGSFLFDDRPFDLCSGEATSF